jgi:hypothetical protein
MYTHESKCKNDKIKLKLKKEGQGSWSREIEEEGSREQWKEGHLDHGGVMAGCV